MIYLAAGICPDSVLDVSSQDWQAAEKEPGVPYLGVSEAGAPAAPFKHHRVTT